MTRTTWAWVIADRWGSRFVSVLVLAAMSRLLDPADIGAAALALAASFVCRLPRDAAVKAIVASNAIEHDLSRITRLVAVASASGLVVTCAGVGVALLLGVDADDAALFATCAALFLTNWASARPEGLATRECRFGHLAIRRLISVALGAIIGLSAAAAGAGPFALVLQVVATDATSAIALRIVARRPRTLVINPSVASPSLDSSSVVPWRSYLLLEVASVVGANVDYLIVGLWLGSEALGLYYVAYRVMLAISELLLSIINSVALPTMAGTERRIGGSSSEHYLRYTDRLVTWAIPVYVAVAVSARDVVEVASGAEYTEAASTTAILAVGGAVGVYAALDRVTLLARGLIRAELRLSIWAVGALAAFASIGAVGGIAWVALGVSASIAMSAGQRFVFLTARAVISWAQVRAWLARGALAGLVCAASGTVVSRVLDGADAPLRLVIAGTCTVATGVSVGLVVARLFSGARTPIGRTTC